MLASLTANINRAEGVDPIKHSMFLRYPAAEGDLVEGMCPEAIAITLSLIPSSQMAELLLGIREMLTSTYLWETNRFLYN
jgi:hypothetical protein